jgi:outer membrane lipoprotein SlyB
MERNEELRNDEIKRAEELREAELRRAAEGSGDVGYTSSDSLVRDDSLVARNETDTLADRTVRANDGIVVRHGHEPTVGDQVGEAAGGIGGVLAGAAIGSIGGPIGTVIGGIAGAIGGWWTGRAIAEAASNFSHADDEHFRTDYTTRAGVSATDIDRSYDRVRPAYQLGYLASRNPDYAGRSFEDIEPHLEQGWTGNAAVEGSDWNEMRDYARTAYVRGAASQSSLTGDSSAKNSLSSTGTHGSVGTGADVPESEPEGTVDQYGRRTPTTSFAGDSATDAARTSSPRSSIADDVESRLMSPKGSSFTRQGDVPLNSSATDSAGTSRPRGYDNQQSRQRDLQSSDANRGPSFTDPVAGEGVENIGSSGLAPRGEDGALNETADDDALRNEGEDRSQRY